MRYEKHLENSYEKRYSEASLNFYINHAKIIQMPKINYFTQKESVKEYIFTRERNSLSNFSNNDSQISENKGKSMAVMKNYGSANNSITISTSGDIHEQNLKNTNKISNAPLNKSVLQKRPKTALKKYKAKEKAQNFLDDEIINIADEFNPDELHIFEDFVMRKIQRNSLIPEIPCSPSKKYFRNSPPCVKVDEKCENLRQRSITTTVSSGLFNRLNSNMTNMTQINKLDLNSTIYTEQLFMRSANFKQGTFNAILEHDLKTDRNSLKQDSSRKPQLTEFSLKSDNFYQTHDALNSTQQIKNISISEKCRKMIEAISEKGEHKFKNSTQAIPKKSHTCIEIEEVSNNSQVLLGNYIPLNQKLDLNKNIFAKKTSKNKIPNLYSNFFANV